MDNTVAGKVVVRVEQTIHMSTGFAILAKYSVLNGILHDGDILESTTYRDLWQLVEFTAFDVHPIDTRMFSIKPRGEPRRVDASEVFEVVGYRSRV